MDSYLHLVSHVLSTITIVLCFIQKLPQIMKVLEQKSVAGLNLYSSFLTLISYSFTASYNYVNKHAIMSYMEYPIIMAQELILIYLYLYYSKKLNSSYLLLSVIYCVIIFVLCQGLLPASIFSFCVACCTPISLSSKVLQLWELWRLKTADSVSIVTWLLSAFTNYARVYTILLDSADALLLTNFILSGSLSLSIMFYAKYLQNQHSNMKKN